MDDTLHELAACALCRFALLGGNVAFSRWQPRGFGSVKVVSSKLGLTVVIGSRPYTTLVLVSQGLFEFE